uniref:NACHT domain-containing protein n=1 Tax=Caulobacter sp. (strain K31) TaxID=366602 RepID=B0T9H8_CAUSK
MGVSTEKTKTAPSPLDLAVNVLADRLRALDAAGEASFESLLAEIMTEVTGQRFDLSKSGPQGGGDLRTLPDNRLQVGLEAKRYQAGTSLPYDQLQAKIFDASRQADPVDLWVLAATRYISGTDQQNLRRAGEDLGIAVLVLDWPATAEALPRLAVLCALAPLSLARRLGADRVLAEALSAISADSRFAGLASALVAELTNADIGLAAATRALMVWTRQAQQSLTAARQRLDGYNNLLEGRQVADRPGLRQALDAWWETGDGPGALIGDEGHGKTWASLAWWDGLAEAGKDAPLLLFISAREIGSADAETTLAKLVADRTKTRNAAFWRRRLRLWGGRSHQRPRLLLVVDALDQHWSRKDWADFVQPLYDADHWGGLVSVLVTCRPDPWAMLGQLSGLAPAPTTILVPPFSDPELDALLDLHGLTRDDFAPAVLTLMAVPRLSLLAIESHAALAESGDVTPERLAYEDWKHRLGRKRQAGPFSDVEFKLFLAQLGAQIRDAGEAFSLTRAALTTQLTADSGLPKDQLTGAVSEMVDGRWLEPGDQPHHFKVSRERTPFALGMSLAVDLRHADDEAAASARIAEFLDPLKGQSLGVAVLRAAATVSMIDRQIGEAARRAIFRRWLGEQNLSAVDFQALWRLVGQDGEMFFDLAEAYWSQGSRGLINEILLKTCANSYRFESFATILKSRVSRWMGRVWGLGSDAVVVQARLAAWSQDPFSADAPPLEWVPGDPGQAQRRMIGVLSLVPRAEVMDAIGAWALSRALMETPAQMTEMAWVLRENRDDPDEAPQALDALIVRLGATGPLGQRAARLLQRARGTVSGARLAPLEPSDLSGSVKDPSRLLEGLDLLNPAATPPPQAFVPIDANKLRTGMANTPTDAALASQRLALARLDVGQLIKIHHEMVATAASRPIEALAHLTRGLEGDALALSELDRLTLAATLTDRVLGAGPEEEPFISVINEARLRLSLWGRTTAMQVPILDAHLVATGADLSNELINLLEQPKDDDLSAIFERLRPDRPAPVLIGWLQVLIKRSATIAVGGWDGLSLLVVHDDAVVRRLALELACKTINRHAQAALVASAWSSDQARHVDERAYGSWALIDAQEQTPIAALLDRIDPQAYGAWLFRCPDDLQALALFGDFVRAALREVSHPTKSELTFPRYWNDQEDGLRTLVERDEAFVTWLEGWLEAWTRDGHADFMETFPLISLSKVLLEARPELGARFWKRTAKALERDIVTRDDVPWLPLWATPSAAVLELRAQAFDVAKTDRDLFDIARGAAKSGRQDWLLERVDEDCERADNPARVARAITVLGFFEDDESLELRWRRLAQVAEAGWLAGVLAKSRAAYDRNRHARHWFERFLDVESDAEAFAAYELFLHAADGRSRHWARGLLWTRAADKPLRRAHWRANGDRLTKSWTSYRKALDDTLYGTPVCRTTNAPWL